MDRPAYLGGPKAVVKDGSEATRWPIYGREEEEAVLDVLRGAKMSGTEITAEFERRFADWNGTKYAVGYSSGTMSLAAAMFAVGLGRGDEIICPSVTYWASVIQSFSMGATPVFCDIDPLTLCLDPADVEKRITPHTRAIMAVHYLAHPADMDRIMEIARRRGIKVIEDVSHAQGGSYKGRRLGTIGDVGAMSLMSGKSFAIGEAGMLVTDDREIYDRAVAYGHYERFSEGNIETDYLRPYCGLPLGGVKGRMHQMSSAVGLVQLKYYDERCAEIRRAMNRFWDLLEGTPGVIPHRVDERTGSNMAGWYCAHGIYDAQRLGGLPIAKFCAAVRAEGLDCVTPGANRPLHTHPMMHTADLYHDGKPTRIAFSDRDVRETANDLPVAGVINKKLFYIPWIKKDDREYIEQAALAFRKVCGAWKELLADPREYPEPDGAWYHFGAPKQ